MCLGDANTIDRRQWRLSFSKTLLRALRVLSTIKNPQRGKLTGINGRKANGLHAQTKNILFSPLINSFRTHSFLFCRTSCRPINQRKGEMLERLSFHAPIFKREHFGDKSLEKVNSHTQWPPTTFAHSLD